MVTETPESSSVLPDGEIDPREVASALRRRWIWVAGGGLLGVAIAGISTLMPLNRPLESIRMVVDTTQGPCIWTQRKFQKFEEPEVLNIKCAGEFLSARRKLTLLASDEFPSDEFDFDGLDFGNGPLVKVQPFKFGTKNKRNVVVSKTQLEVVVESDNESLDQIDINSRLERIKRRYADNRISNIKKLSPNVEVGENWITFESDSVVMPEPNPYAPLTFGLLVCLVMGSGAALIVDSKSNRVFSNSKILGHLGYPLWLTLPTLPWSDQVAGPLIGQLAARLDRSLDWRVLSIAHDHEASA